MRMPGVSFRTSFSIETRSSVLKRPDFEMFLATPTTISSKIEWARSMMSR
jgi:hypothetical protein